MVFRQVGNDTDKLSAKFGLLNKSFKNIKKDLLNKQGWRSFGNIVSQQDITNFSKFQQEFNNGVKFHKAFNNNLLHSHTRIQQQAFELRKLNSEQYLLNRQLRYGKITQQEYNTAMTTNKAAIQALTTQTQTLTFAQKAATAASKALSVALNLALNVGFVIAINGIISLITHLVNRQQEAIDKAKELSQEYKEHCDTLKDLRKEYLGIIESTKSASDKDKELIEWKKKLVEQYGFEEEALKGINAERQTGIELLDEELYKSARKAVNDLEQDNVAQEAMMKYYGLIDTQKQKEGYYGGQYRDAISHIDFMGFANAWAEKDAAEYVHSLVNAIESEIEGIDVGDMSEQLGTVRLERFGMELNVDDAQDAFDKIDQLLTLLKKKREGLVFQGKDSEVNILDRIIKTVENKRGDIQKIIDENQEIVSQYLSSQAQMIYADYAKGLNSVQSVTEETYSTWKDGLLAMAGESEPLRKALAKIADETFPQFANSADGTAEGVNSKYVPSVQKLTDAYEDLEEQLQRILDLKDEMKDFLEVASTFSESIKKIVSGESLDFDELQKLLEIEPTLIYSVSKSDDGGYTIDKDKLRDTAQDYGTANNPYKDDYEKSQEKVAALEKELADLQSKSSDPRIASDGFKKRIDEVTEQLSLTKQELATNEIMYSSYRSLLDTSVNTAYSDRIKNDLETISDEVEDKVGDYNSSITDLTNAINNMDSGTALTYDEVTELVKSFPAINGLVKEGADGFYVEVEALKSLRDETYETRNQFIEDEKTKIQAAISEAQNRIKVWEIEIGIYKKFGENYDGEIEAIQGYIDSASENLSSLESYIALLDSMKGTVHSSTGKSSTSDTVSEKLQQEIDYYDEIIKGIEAVSDKRIEAIDKEIEAINEQKDALKEQNDERQRELDLIEAQNDLDKAKKQKVFVYKEGQGLVQVQDEKAVKDAQKELDDAQREIKEAEYDKQIDMLEQQSKATEEYRNTFSDMKSDIEDAMAVEQAKAALGTDEKGLLSLDKSAINGIQNGLAKAVVEKENEDNKDNPRFEKFSIEDFLRKHGSNATAEEFKAKFYEPLMRSFSPEKLYNIQDRANTQYNITNNSPTTFTATFNISGATDPNEVAKVVRTEITDLLQKTYNKIK